MLCVHLNGILVTLLSLFNRDSVPHVSDADLDQEKIYTLIGNVTTELRTVFSNTTLFPVLGNHDPFPANMMPYDVETSNYYKGILEKSQWDDVLGHNESEQFHNGKNAACTWYLQFVFVNALLLRIKKKLT